MLLDDIKVSLRISSEAFDGEIKDLIFAARRDLIKVGVSPNQANAEVTADPETTIDPLVKMAITTYVKANFGLDNEDSEKYQHSYAMLRNDLSMAQDYSAGDADV